MFFGTSSLVPSEMALPARNAGSLQLPSRRREGSSSWPSAAALGTKGVGEECWQPSGIIISCLCICAVLFTKRIAALLIKK